MAVPIQAHSYAGDGVHVNLLLLPGFIWILRAARRFRAAVAGILPGGIQGVA